LKIKNQSPVKIFPSKSAGKFSIKVWLQKGNRIGISVIDQLTTKTGSLGMFFNQSLTEIFSSKSG